MGVGYEMKSTNFLIMFFVAILSIAILLNVHTNELALMANKYAEYNNAVDTAIDAAMTGLVEVADIDGVQLSYQGSVDVFFKTLYSSFGALDNEVMQQDLQLYTPVICIADTDGFFILHNSVGTNGKLVKAWSEKLPYSHQFSFKDSLGHNRYYTVNFTLGDTVYVTCNGDERIYSGDYKYLKSRYSGTSFADDWYDNTIFTKPGTFNNWKNAVVVDSITEQMNYYVKHNNSIAQSYGISYDFSLPESSQSDLANGISGITFIALFQGYPYGTGTDSVFSKFCVSGSQMSKAKVYYIRKGKDGRYYYHVADCNVDLGIKDENGLYHLGENGFAVTSAERAASTGALPCPECCY